MRSSFRHLPRLLHCHRQCSLMRSHVSDRNGSCVSGEISRNLLVPEDTDIDTLRRIAVSVKRLAAADVVSVVLPPLSGHGQLSRL